MTHKLTRKEALELALAGKTIVKVGLIEGRDFDHESLVLQMSDGTTATISCFGWADGVASDGGELTISFSPNTELSNSDPKKTS